MHSRIIQSLPVAGLRAAICTVYEWTHSRYSNDLARLALTLVKYRAGISLARVETLGDDATLKDKRSPPFQSETGIFAFVIPRLTLARSEVENLARSRLRDRTFDKQRQILSICNATFD